jgi:hypothetical protein
MYAQLARARNIDHNDAGAAIQDEQAKRDQEQWREQQAHKPGVWSFAAKGESPIAAAEIMAGRRS